MTIFQGVVLGLVQGATEFLPVSSTAHLILLPRFLGWPAHSLAVDAFLHLGTGLAALVYFWGDWLEMLRSLWADLRDRHSAGDFAAASRRLIWMAVASLPVGMVGLFLGNWVEASLRGALTVAVSLAVVGGLMIVAEKLARRRVGRMAVNFGDVFGIGVAQILALVPGVSRSGITVTTGIFRGLTLETAARVSFLVGTPVVLAAGVWEVFKLLPLAASDYFNLAGAFGASFFAGLLAIFVFLKLIRRLGLWPFAVYRLGLALAIFPLLR